MAIRRALKILFLVVLLFAALVFGIFYLLANGIITPQLARLMMVALLGLYFGFGVLIAAYRLVSKLY